jgi:anti-sigma factor RsiW
MNCGITGEDWTDYLDRTLPVRDRRRIDAHLLGCAACRSEAERLRHIEQRLRIDFGLLRQAVDGEMTAGAEQRIMAALRELPGMAKGPDVHEKLWRVRWVLAMLCGPNTAGRVIDCARQAGGSDSSLAAEQGWAPFLRRLSLLTTEICGCHAGELIIAVGK